MISKSAHHLLMKTSFSYFLQRFQTCQSLFLLDESLWCALIVKVSQSPSVYLSTSEVSTLMFARRGGWTMHLLPQLGMWSSPANLSVKSKHSKKHVHTSTLIPFNHFILQYNTGLCTAWGYKKKKNLLGYNYCTCEKWENFDKLAVSECFCRYLR